MTTPANDNTGNRAIKKYLSFSEFHTDINRFPFMTELYLTPKEGFFIKDLYDLEMKKMYFNVLSKLDVSENIISKLVLKSFLNLKIIIASRNIIKEVNLILPKLVKLDLSYNFINKMFDLSYLPCLKELNLSNNLIEKVSIKEFQDIKFTLTELYLDNNKINFEANDFLSFIEGLKIFNLVKFSLEGNDFIQNNKSLTFSYNLFIVATITSLKNLNYQEIIINRENLLSDAIKNQILAEDEAIQIKNLKTKNQNQKREKFVTIEEVSDLEVIFKKINKNFDDLLKSGGKNQKIFFALIDSVNYVLNSNLKENILEEAVGEEGEFIGMFNLFLMNCLLLIEMNESLEITVLNPIAQFSLFGGGYLCDKCFDFFESLVKSSSKRIDNILIVFEGVILKKLEETNRQLPFNCLKIIIKFFQNTKITFSKLYKNLIGVISKELKTIMFENYKDPLELMKDIIKQASEEDNTIIKTNSFIQNLLKFKKPIVDEKIDRLITCIQFINEYWKIPEEALVEDGDSVDNSSEYEENEDENEEKEDEDNFIEKLMQEDVEVEKEYGINFDNSIFEEQNITLDLFKLCMFTIGYYIEFLESYLNMKNERFDLMENVIDLGIKLCQNIEKHINAKKFNSSKQLYIKDLMSLFNIKKAYARDDNTSESDSFNILETLSIFLQQSLGSYVLNSNYFYEYIKKYYANLKKDEDSSSSLAEDEKKVRIIFANLIHLFGCFIKHCNDNTFKVIIDDRGVSLCFQILSSNNNDPFILTGACKFFLEILNHSKIMSDQMSFSKIMTKIVNIKTILNYIDYENIKYRQICDILHKFDPLIIINNNPVAFEKLENENLLEMIEFIISLIAQFCMMANRTGAIATLCIQQVRVFRDYRMYTVLGNCLKINNDNVRKAVVNCIYYNDHTTITNDVIKQIINIISTYSSVSDGETEIILSTIYLILNKIMNENINSDNNSCTISENNLMESINLAMTFLLRNTDRNINDLNEIDQKNSLSTSLLIYLNTCSSNPKNWVAFQRKELEDVIHGCLFNDFSFYHPYRYIPIEIERIYPGNYIGFLFEIMKQTNPVLPYSYIFLRTLIKIGDVLLNTNETLFPIDYSKEIDIMVDDLKSDLKRRFTFKISNELKNWYDFERLMKFEVVEKEVEANKKEKRISFMKELSEEEYLEQQLNFVVFFPNLLIYILGKTSYLLELGIDKGLMRKFDKKLLACENIYFLMEEYNKNNVISNTDLLDKNFEQTFINDFKVLAKPSHKNEKQKFSTFITNYLICTRNNITYDWHYMKKCFYGVFQKDLTEYSLFGIEDDSKRFNDEENHNNPHLRSLIVGAFLRCIYTVLVSPYKIVSYNFIEIILNNNLIKDIIILSDITLIFEYNIHHKIFTVISHLFNKNNIKIIEKQKDNIAVYKTLYYNCNLVSVFIEKIIYFYYEMNIPSKQRLDISFCKDFICCIKEFVNFVVLLDLEKLKIDMEFTRYWILQNVAKQYTFDLYFYIISEITRNTQSALKDLKQFDIESLNIKNVSFIKDHILNYVLNLEKYIYEIRDILAFYIEFYPICKEYVFSLILKAYMNKRNFEKEDNKLRENKSEVEKILERVLFRSKICKICISMSKEMDEFIDYMEISEIYNYPEKKARVVILALTESKLMLYDKKEENNNILLENKIEYELKDLEAIFIYDYLNRIFLVFKDNRINPDETNYNLGVFGNKNFVYFSLFFSNIVNSMMFIEKVMLKNSNISIINFNSFHVLLHKILEDYSEAIIEKLNFEENKVKEDNAKQDEIEKKKWVVEDYTKKYTIKNNIYSHLNYSHFFKFSDYDCFFVISLNYKTLIDYFNVLNILYDDSSLLLEHKKILCINRGFLYIFRESFDKFNLTLDDILNLPDDNNVVACNSSNAYDLLIMIKIKSIIEVLVDEKYYKARICYKIKDKSDTNNLYLDFSFSDNYEFELFCYYMNLTSGVVRGLHTDMYSEEENKEEFDEIEDKNNLKTEKLSIDEMKGNVK